MNAPEMSALTISVRRKPNQRSAVEAVNFIAIAPAAVAKVSAPDWNGVRPKPICSSSGRRKGRAPMPMRKMQPADHAGEEGRDLQELEIEDGVFVAPRVPHIERRAGRGSTAIWAATSQPGAMPRPISDSPEIRPSSPSAGEEKAGEIEARHRLLAQVGDVSQRQGDAEHADRHVDPEDPAPVEIGGDEAAERRSDDRARSAPAR